MDGLEVAFRVDCSDMIGTGHIMRCRNLARMMKQSGCSVKFLGKGIRSIVQVVPGLECVEFDGTDFSKVKLEDTSTWLGGSWELDADETCRYLKGVDLLITDHYGIDHRWEKRVLGVQPRLKLMCIDDLADRRHSCSLLLDQTLRLSNVNPYQDLCPSDCRFLLGPKYCLVNEIFHFGHRRALERAKALLTTSNKECYMICFGGSDIVDATAMSLRSMIELAKELPIDKVIVVCGRLYQSLGGLERLAKTASFEVEIHQGCSQEKLIELLESCSGCIGGAGVSCYERCCLGVPSLVITIAENQIPNASSLSELGAIDWVGNIQEVTQDEEKWKLRVRRFLTEKEHRRSLREAGLKLLDGNGIRNILKEIEQNISGSLN